MRFLCKKQYMAVAGYLASVLIGISLGLIGGGGSILTMPVLVYLFNVSPVLATSYSLFVVGSASLVGAWNNYKKGLVSVLAGIIIGRLIGRRIPGEKLKKAFGNRRFRRQRDLSHGRRLWELINLSPYSHKNDRP
jgi:uncharacterized membrane protein YfcA